MTPRGITTSEFWLTLIAILCMAAVAVDLFPVGSLGAKVVAMVSLTLSSLGYVAARSYLKGKDPT